MNHNKLNQLVFKGFLILSSSTAAVLVAFSRYKRRKKNYLFVCTFRICFSLYHRVYLEYHTFEQVAVGALVGILFGGVWFYAVHNIFSNFFHLITTWYNF
jgi:hypothetical protein